MTSTKPERFALLFGLFALLLGVGCGILHVLVETLEEPDPLLSALAVTMATMLLGVLRPARPWRWVLLVGIPVPLALLVAKYVIPTAHFTRASIAGSILVSLPGCAGAFGGSLLRRKLSEIFFEEKV
jgi:ABC-type Na+ efflux pump permease subunit